MSRSKWRPKPERKLPVLSLFQTDQHGTITISVSHGMLTKERLTHLSAFGVTKARILETGMEVDLKFKSEKDCQLMTNQVVGQIAHALGIRFQVIHRPEIRKIKTL